MALTDKKTLYAVLGVVVLVLVGLTVLGSEFDVQRWAGNRVSLCREVLRAKDELKHAELCHADYIVTGNDTELSAFLGAIQRFHTHLDAARQDAQLKMKLEPIRSEAGHVINEMKISANVRAVKGEQAARSLMSTVREERQLAELDSSLTDVAQYEVWLLQERLHAYTTVIDYVRWCFIGGALVYVAAYMYMARAFQPALRGAEEKNRQLSNELEMTRAQLDRLTNMDSLTETLNANGLEQALVMEQNRTGRGGNNVVAMLVNCDNFKAINDAHGTVIGDAVLKEISRRMSGIVRPSDHVGRIGADEFLIILTDTQLAYAMRVADRLRTSASDTPLRIGSETVEMTVCIGVASLPHDVATLEQALELTRTALKRSKISGKNRVSLAREQSSVKPVPEPSRDIIEVLCDGAQFRTVFQPVVDLSTDQITGYEIFTRGPDGTFESPAEFFRVCVENNILTNVDILCLKLAIGTVANIDNKMRWHINVFPSTLMDTAIENFIALFPQDQPGRYCVELSEEQFVGDPGYLRDHIAALKQAGILVAIDDIGFGRGSLESLILLEPDIVKVDRKYVTGVSKEPGKQRLLKRVVNVGKSLGAEVVAEGIEVKDDLPFLREIGVHYGQGYYWGELLEILPESLEVRPAYPL